MRRRTNRTTCWIAVGLLASWSLDLASFGAEEPPIPPPPPSAEAAPAATAATPTPTPTPFEFPAPAVGAPDPTNTPTAADPTGANYTGADTTAKLTKSADGKVTPGTLVQDVKLLKVGINILWALVAGFLVMFMQAGFALVETGMTRYKNVAHTMAMNFLIYAIGMIGFWICGYAFQMGGVGPLAVFDGPNVLNRMYTIHLFGADFGILGHKGFFLGGDANDATVLTMFLFQMVFMDTAATIPTGALAERWKFSAFVVFGFYLSMLIYPVYACWVWGGGWLSQLGVNFGIGNGHIDFAGSSVVHMTGGVTALAGAIVLGPRIGKFNKDGSANPIPGHNVPMAMLGTFILAFGWFGFNAGSTLAVTDLRLSSIAVCTMLASAAGALSSTFYMWARYGKPDPTMACNGLLAGAVAITAPCAFVNPVGAVVIGAGAGILVIWSVLFVEKTLKVDDPVGAISVHGVNGAFGALCIGLFADGKYGTGLNGVAGKTPLGLFYGGGMGQLTAQIIGVLANFLWVFPVAYLCFYAVEKTMGNRVKARTEVEGLDLDEMGVPGYLNEDLTDVENAGREHLAHHGPGVPRSNGNGHGNGEGNGKAIPKPKVPTGIH